MPCTVVELASALAAAASPPAEVIRRVVFGALLVVHSERA
jgi:hypothetical protein